MSEMPLPGQFAVLNPGGRDAFCDYANGVGQPDDSLHPPVNYHAYAACMGGVFARTLKEVPDSCKGVLVLLRKRHLEEALRCITALRDRGIRSLISWKESGLHQVTDALSDPGRMAKFSEICMDADFYLSSTPELGPVYESAGCLTGKYLPTPYPVEEARWDFSLPLESRKGVFIGTREFDIPSRNHLLALTVMADSETPVTVINTGGRSTEKLTRAISKDITIVNGPLSYGEYLSLMAKHRIVFQLDRSAVPGQVAGDALLTRTPCVGGDGAIERLAYASLCGAGKTIAELLTLSDELLTHDERWLAEQRGSQIAARSLVSFSAARAELCLLLGITS